MHIRKLEICGFKSFVDRTVIHFDHDVIGIVGPNGCGKSNIVDAIRWCMGEQSAKHLRGKAMEDVIFNGSESRGPHGFAEVTLTFDNTDRDYAAALPPEYSAYPEIGVTRRLFRDGTSEYLINRTPVRWRDVTELFLGTGVGTKAYSIVEQGRIGQIVSARAEDRRLFIEEAAGITKYKKRRQQAERKMDQTRQNLLRVTDIVNEIERTRSSLKRQAAKAERFIRYREELEELMLHQSTHTLLEMIVVERVEREALGSGNARASDARGRLQVQEAALEASREEAAAIEHRAEEAAQAAFRADNQVTSLEAELARSRDQLSHLDERLRVADSEQTDLRLRREHLSAEGADLDARLESLRTDIDAREADALQEESELAELREGEIRADEGVSTLRQQVAEATTQQATAQARLDALAQRLSEGRTRRDRLSTELDSIESEVSELSAREAAFNRSVSEWAEGRRLGAAEFEALEHELTDLRPRALEAERAADTVKNDLSLKRNRLRVLEDLHRRLEGVGTGTRALLSAPHPIVQGLLADRIEVAEEYTAALAGLLGDKLQCVVVSNPEEGLELLRTLRDERRGRATITSARPQFVAGAARMLPECSGVLGFLVDYVRFAEEDEALVRSLVGDAVLCESPQEALAVARARPEHTAVALDGTVARGNGLISGGSGDDAASGIVEQKREMRRLVEEVATLDEKHTQLAEEHRRLRARMADVGTSLDRARQGVHENELAQVSAEKDLTRTVAELSKARARGQAITAELAELDQSLKGAVDDEDEFRRKLDTVSRELAELEQTLTRATESATTWKERVATRTALVTEKKVRLAQTREQLEAIRGSRLRVDTELNDAEERSRRLTQEANETAESFGQIAAGIVLRRERLTSDIEEARKCHTEHDEVRRLLDEIRNALGERETELKELRTELTLLEEAARGHELKLQKLELEREHLLQSVREKFRGLDLHRVVGKYHAMPPPDAEHRRRVDELTRLIERMGPVNLDAQTDYEDAEKRFVELSDQKVDIEKALIDLEHAIKHMNRESRKRFRETFDSVNDLFKATFTRLFRGGRAELVLTNPEDLLETGVDIVAQPPGKRLGNIELMSGGEKALTATSLIFAIFQHKPSPFCILDEVDAPLDEANVARYNEAIRGMTDRSQFIVITHIKSTMQAVDVLYGVTMGEPGVSRIVSVKVNEEARARSERAHSVLAGPPESEEQDASTQVA